MFSEYITLFFVNVYIQSALTCAPFFPHQQVILEMTDGGADYCFECIGLAALMNDAFLSSREVRARTRGATATLLFENRSCVLISTLFYAGLGQDDNSWSGNARCPSLHIFSADPPREICHRVHVRRGEA